eukprot:COSAG03_NODE_18101_length_362_cov_0.558935_2_plen_33_part_01
MWIVQVTHILHHLATTHHQGGAEARLSDARALS